MKPPVFFFFPLIFIKTPANLTKTELFFLLFPLFLRIFHFSEVKILFIANSDAFKKTPCLNFSSENRPKIPRGLFRGLKHPKKVYF
jgi:hypothetical protein